MWNKLEEIRRAKGHEKIKILKENPNLKKLLIFAYDPFLKFNLPLAKIETFLESIVFGDDVINDTTWEILRRIGAKAVTGNKALNMLFVHLRKKTEKDADIIRRIIKKDLEIGINRKTIEKAWPNLFNQTENGLPGFPVMLCQSLKEDKVKFPCFISKKLDGIRARYIHNKLYTRNKKIIKGIDHILQELRNFPYELDGELIVPGNKFDSGSGLIRSSNDIPTAEYHIFDTPNYPGDKNERYLYLVDNFALSSKYFKTKLIPHTVISCMRALKDEHRLNLIDDGEGSIVCSLFGKYENKRSWDWMKWTPKYTLDLLCKGIFEGKGRFIGTTGGILVIFNGVLVRVGTGFTFKERQEIWKNYISNSNYYKDKIAEIEYKEISSKGKLRQPRFKCWRFDK